MEIEKVLLDYGLEIKEIKVYLALLKFGELSATKIAEKTNLDRTLMYQITNKLIEKGLCSYIIKNNVKYFNSTTPQILVENLEEKKNKIEKILPQLTKMQNEINKETKVETYRGKEGVNTILKMIIKDSQNYYIQGGAEKSTKLFEFENKVFVKRAEQYKLKGKILARKNDNFFIGELEELKFLPENMISSTSQILWGNKTAIFIWNEPYYVILIDSLEITKSNIKTFNYLFSIAESPTKNQIKKIIFK